MITTDIKKKIEQPYWTDKNDEVLDAIPNQYQPIPVHVIGAGPTKENLIKIYDISYCPALIYHVGVNDKTSAIIGSFEKYRSKLFPALKREFGFTATDWEETYAVIDEYICALSEIKEMKFNFSTEELDLLH